MILSSEYTCFCSGLHYKGVARHFSRIRQIFISHGLATLTDAGGRSREAGGGGGGGSSPCAACKLLRRRCAHDCVFAPYFPADQPHKFASVHKVFGASNVNKMLQELPEHQRGDAVSSMVYEANARVRDPVYGCVGAISSLQQQIDMLQAQLALAQAEVVRMHVRVRQFSFSNTNNNYSSSDKDASPSSLSHHQPKSLFTIDMDMDMDMDEDRHAIWHH
ncbi:LOB domain-containing protein 4-like [Andrographis paniculata]|uniref:LOB domain-containing protein 4-like n=1 Tax=Andrographis paniculata TaxID=175694 RepID=UPI0021E96254|nr:LOB domain-containing protein 4-like [Andrographis paniculata]